LSDSQSKLDVARNLGKQKLRIIEITGNGIPNTSRRRKWRRNEV